MVRSSATGETGTADAEPVGMDQALQPVRAGGRGRPIGLTLALVAVLTALIWQPWGRGGSPVLPAAAPSTPAALVAEGVPSSSPGASPGASPGPSPSSTPRGPRPDFRPAGSDTSVSLLDDEWTVVAFVSPNAQAAPEDPWLGYATDTNLAPGRSLVVLQQQLGYAVKPTERPGDPDAPCRAPGGFREAGAAHLVAGWVAYIGVTFPGMSANARVTASVIGQAGFVLKRLPLLIVPTVEAQGAGRYTVRSSGVGGAVLFALAPPGILPRGTYRFDVVTPGTRGHRYLYACIEP